MYGECMPWLSKHQKINQKGRNGQSGRQWVRLSHRLVDTGVLWGIGEGAILQFGGQALILHDCGAFL